MGHQLGSPPVSGATPDHWLDGSDRPFQHWEPSLSPAPASMADLSSKNVLLSIESRDELFEVLSPGASVTPTISNNQRTKNFINAAPRLDIPFTYKREDSDDGMQEVVDTHMETSNNLPAFEADATNLTLPKEISRPSIFGPKPASKGSLSESSTPSAYQNANFQATNTCSVILQDIEEDDIIEICLEDASPDARVKWKEFEFSQDRDEDLASHIKREKTASPAPAFPRRLMTDEDYLTEMQRLMPAQNVSQKGSANGLDARHQVAGIGGRNDLDGLVDDRMADHEEDAWMNENPEDEGELVQLGEIRDKLLNKRSNGAITNSEREKLFDVQIQIRKLDRKKAAQELLADGNESETLFVPDTDLKESDPVARYRTRHENDEDFARLLGTELTGGGFNIAKGNGFGGKSRKSRGKVAKTAREFAVRQAEKQREKDQKKAQKKRDRELASKKPRKNTAPNMQKNKRKGKAQERHLPPSIESNKFSTWSGHDEVGQRILDSLMSNDPISERLCNPIFNVGSEPEISGKYNKTTQLNMLYANIPESSEGQSGRGDKARLQAASRSFGYGNVKAKDGKWLLKGMTSPLLHHQLIGAEWMLQREFSENAPYGGFVADSMGLGKTVQTLACMVANYPMAQDIKRNVKATLIVCPASIGPQWIEEIQRHTTRSAISKTILYKTSMGLIKDVLQDMEVVVTSYGQVMKQLPFPTVEERQEIKANGAQGYKKWWDSAKHNVGPLHQIDWYRVVLDEAHAIKNNSSRTSLACQNLNSVYRWCLSGTPLMNRLEELFPYLRFLKANYSMTQDTFTKYFCDPHAPSSFSRIENLFSYAMIRRTMKTSILGRPIITLPTPHPFIRYVPFSPAENIIYRITEQRFRSNMNRYFERGVAERKYSCFMVHLLRLRQCTSHFFMLERTIKESWTREDVRELERRLLSIGFDGSVTPFYQQIGMWVKDAEASRDTAEICETQKFGKSSFGHGFDIRLALKTLNDENLRETVLCGICSDVLNEAESTDCGHLFCRGCIRDDMNHQLSTSEYATCPICNNIFHNLKRIEELDHDYDGGSLEVENDEASNSGDMHPKKNKSPGSDMRGYEPSTKDSTWVSMSDTESGFSLAPSAKTTALKTILLKSFEVAPMDKVVIYVQFRTLARIVGRICQAEGWGFLYFDGCLSRDSRTKVIDIFRTDDDAKVLISGIKCGGLGLNLEWANRCISLDLWWNHAVEQQAFGRIFRLGQQKETHMGRIVIKDSVDMRLLKMQAHKLAICEKAVQSGDLRKNQKLSLRELATLFGFLRTDEDDKILSIEPDYNDQQEWDKGGAGWADYDET